MSRTHPRKAIHFTALALWGVAACADGCGGSARPTAEGEAPGGTPIHDIQGAAHRSPMEGAAVSDVRGVVTHTVPWGFHLQAPRAHWDDDDATSEAVFVYTRERPTVEVGDAVSVDGRVRESVPGGDATGNLPTTEVHAERVEVRASGQPLPPPVVLGEAGRPPPTERVAFKEAPLGEGPFDPARYGIDFYESLEGMRVEVRQPVAVGPTHRAGTIAVVGDGGAHATQHTLRGGLYLSPTDRNPERIHLDARWTDGAPTMAVGDRLEGPVIGVLGYAHGRFRVYVTEPWPAVARAGPGPEGGTSLRGDAEHLTIASLNAEGLHPGDADGVAGVARVILEQLGAPDVVALQEVQDGNGRERGELSAAASFEALVAEVAAQGGPAYGWAEVAPHEEDADGGPPGGNIRVGYLWRTDRVHLPRRGEAGAMDPSEVVPGPDGRAQLVPNPGRIEPTHGVWSRSRKPLAAELVFEGRRLFVVNVHLRAKIGDAPRFGAEQPPPEPSVAQRTGQARVVARWVAALREADPNARVIVLGDFNDFDWSRPLGVLTEAGLHNLMTDLPPADRYTYVYFGNSQALDHILVSTPLMEGAQVDAVHLHAEQPWTSRVSDHDPVTARLRVD
jgi:uncharacterized protein